MKTKEGSRHSIDIVMVSESPEHIVAAQEAIRPLGLRLVGCLGPAQSPCYLSTQERCPLVDHATAVLVDSPATGRFVRHWHDIPAGTYAEGLASLHPDTQVILCGVPEGSGGTTGDVTVCDRGALPMVEFLGDLFTRLSMRSESA
jgi:hypothetical protein